MSLALGNGCAVFGEKGCDKAITMRDLPAAVKPLAEKEIAGCKIIEVEQEMKDGKVIYAITYDQAGTKMEVEYRPTAHCYQRARNNRTIVTRRALGGPIIF